MAYGFTRAVRTSGASSGRIRADSGNCAKAENRYTIFAINRFGGIFVEFGDGVPDFGQILLSLICNAIGTHEFARLATRRALPSV